MIEYTIHPSTYSVSTLLRMLDNGDKHAAIAVITALRITGDLNRMPVSQRAAIAAELTELTGGISE